jgi:hypothetical protein
VGHALDGVPGQYRAGDPPAPRRSARLLSGCGLHRGDDRPRAALLDAFIYGFAPQEANLPSTGGEPMTELAGSIAKQFEDGQYPHLIEMTVERVLKPDYDFAAEFDFGLDLILNGLQATARLPNP